MVESQPSKLLVAGSSPVSRSRIRMFFVYILKSKIIDRHYIGQTSNLEERLTHHNSPRAKWTKRYQPWELVYSEEHLTRSEAMKRESELKRKKNIKKIINRE